LYAGSQKVAELISADMGGRVFLEDAGFDWKILGPDVAEIDYVAWQCDQDAYACSGQKCSAQSIMFMHENWAKTDLLEKVRTRWPACWPAFWPAVQTPPDCWPAVQTPTVHRYLMREATAA
jgi:acyl-CoA reductase-like NAD-dependent aldehyde dehydrogenase